MQNPLLNFFQISIICGVLLLVIQPSFGELESPKKQMEQGIQAQDVICNAGLELVIRTNGFAACVRSETAEKMQKIGMLIIPIKFTDLEKEFKAVSASEKEISTIPASSRSIVNFYINDQDLNIAHNGIEVISTKGLFEFTVNGIAINGPEKMIETGPNTGEFYLRLELPESINGKLLSQEDIVLIKYLDESDNAGEKRILVKSIPLTSAFAKVETSGGGSRIGHEFTLRIFEPDANRDSKEEDRIPLSLFEFRGEGGIRTPLTNPRFDANSSSLIETGPNTNTFEVKIKIPRELDGKVIHIGDKYEIRYIDQSTPSGTSEKVILKGRIG